MHRWCCPDQTSGGASREISVNVYRGFDRVRGGARFAPKSSSNRTRRNAPQSASPLFSSITAAIYPSARSGRPVGSHGMAVMRRIWCVPPNALGWRPKDSRRDSVHYKPCRYRRWCSGISTISWCSMGSRQTAFGSTIQPQDGVPSTLRNSTVATPVWCSPWSRVRPSCPAKSAPVHSKNSSNG